MFYFCHLKKLVRPETFGPYYVHTYTRRKVCVCVRACALCMDGGVRKLVYARGDRKMETQD